MSKRDRSPTRDSRKVAKKIKTKYNSDWESDYVWLDKGSKGCEFVMCKWCKVHFKICYGGKNDLTKHMSTVSHKAASQAVHSSRSLSSMFQSANTESDSVTHAETLFSYFVVEHNLPFLVADHFTDLVKVMFPDSKIAQKFKCKRTKTTNIVNKALGPLCDEKVTTMCKKEKFSIMIDESNDRGDEKLLTVLIRVYDQDVRKISTRFLGIPTCNIGTGEDIFNCVNEIFIVMIGKNNSVLSRVKTANPNVYDLGCVCHLANICTQKAVKTLPLPVDDLLIEVFFHFHHSAKRREQFKDFLEFTDTEPMKILKHCQTRWLSLEKCVARLLLQWIALQ